MGSLLERLGRGAGKALETFGRISLEEQREKRLHSMRERSQEAATKESQEFQTSEREAGQEFKKEMMTSKSAKPDRVKSESTDEMTGVSTITFESGKQINYDPELDTYIERGKGKGSLSDESKSEDLNWGEKMANREAGLFSGDESDFPQFKDETKAAEAAARFRSNARREGTLDEFETAFTKRGWSYIQELAGGKSASTVKEKAGGMGLMSIFKDFDKKDYEGIAKQIVADENASEILKREARDYLSGAS